MAVSKRGAFMLKLPDNARRVYDGDIHVGWAWPVKAAPRRIDPSVRSYAKQDRWAACLLDGERVADRCRTLPEARKVVLRARSRRAQGRPARQAPI